MKPIVSLCIPTNGIIEWVFPVLDSIYEQGINRSKFEVVLTDNGDNGFFKARISEYSKSHENLVYCETNAPSFLNEIEAYKKARGSLIKFVNHRTLLLKGSLQKLIDFAVQYEEEKPIIYFSNGVLALENRRYDFSNFDLFVKGLSYWSSWSTGMAIWKSDFEKIVTCSEFNALFPHTTILFSERKRARYCIDNSVIFHEMQPGNKPKGNYDLFFAFGLEYPWIICTLLRDGNISLDTFKTVLSHNLGFISELYYLYCVKKEYCSYDLSGLNQIFGVFYSKKEFDARVRRILLKNIFHIKK